MSDRFEATWPQLEVRADDFIRTTQPRHEKLVQELWTVIEKKGDLYLASYEGWYCVGCEDFKTEKELLPGNLCPLHPDNARRAPEGGDVLLPPREVPAGAARLLRQAPRVRPARVAPQRGRELREVGAQGSVGLAHELHLGHPGAGQPEARHVRVVRRADQLLERGAVAGRAQEVLVERLGRALRRQGHPALPRRLLAGVPAERRLRAAEDHLRARLPDLQRPEDEQVAPQRSRPARDRARLRRDLRRR